MLSLNRAKTFVSSITSRYSKPRAQRRQYGAAGKRVPVQTKEFFEASPKLVEKRTSDNRLHYVFLEGLAGAGKGSLLERLDKVRKTASLFKISNVLLTKASSVPL
jgi:hypothetical protein